MTRDAQIEQIVSACIRHGGFGHDHWAGFCPAHRAEIAALIPAVVRYDIVFAHEADARIATLTTALAEARAEITVSDQLLADRQRILDAHPCPQHGPCVPYVLALLARLSPPRAETPPNVPTVPPNRELRETDLRAAPVVAPAPVMREMAELLRSACAIAERRGAGTAWERFIRKRLRARAQRRDGAHLPRAARRGPYARDVRPGAAGASVP